MHVQENDLIDRAAAQRELELRRARKDFARFVEYVFGWRLGRHHERWAEAVQQHPRLLIQAPVEHGKSSLLSCAYPLFLLGQDPNLRLAVVSETQTQASRHLASIRERILRDERLHEVFPGLRPSGTRERWSDTEIVVERSTHAKDPSILAAGIMGPLLGARVDVAILDDVVAFENSFTEAQRQKVISWFKGVLVGRIVAGGRVLVIGTPWHPDDLFGNLERGREYVTIRDPAMDEGTGEPLWPEAWSVERLEQRRREIGELEFSRTMLLKVISDTTSRFRPDWFEFSLRAAKDEGVTLRDSYDGPLTTFTGVDLAVGMTAKHDESALVTIALLPDQRRQVLCVEAGRWQAPMLVQKIRETQRRFRSRVRVESSACQAYIGQFLSAEGIRVEAHTTTKAKHLGIEALAVEVEQGRWLIPDAPSTRALIREMLAYSPSSHAGDRLMALWLARESAAAATNRELFPVPFISSNTLPLLPSTAFPVATGAIVAPPSEFPEDAWFDVPVWSR